MEPTQLRTRELIGRVYLALATALVGGVALGGAIGLVGAGQCTAEGFACLGWIVYGIVAAVLLGCGAALWALRRAKVPWRLLVVVLLGIAVLLVTATVITPAAQVLILAAVAWPVLAVICRSGPPGRVVTLVGGFVLLLVAAGLGTTWMAESHSIAVGAQSYARSNATVWGPADDSTLESDSIVSLVSPVDQSLMYSYDEGGNSVHIEVRREPGDVPADGAMVDVPQERATLIRRGDEVILVRITRAGQLDRLIDLERQVAAGLIERSPRWLAGLDEPLHRLLDR